MYEDHIPEHKIGVLAPRSIIENQPYQFYRMAPPRVILVMTPMGLEEFSSADVDRITAGLDEKLDLLVDRGVELIMASGVPLPILLGIEGHDRLLAHIDDHTGVQATSSMENVTSAAKALMASPASREYWVTCTLAPGIRLPSRSIISPRSTSSG